MKSEEIIEKIKAEVNKTGFPLELRVSKLLKSRGYFVNHSAYYIDEDEGKSREIDILSHSNRKFKDEESNQDVYVRNILAIECKKSDNKPWVFLSSEIDEYDDPELEELFVWNFGDLKPFSLISTINIKEAHPFKHYKYRARSFFEAFKGSETGETIFKALTASVKASLFDGKEKMKDDICIYYPMVIFDGRMFQAILDESNEINVSEVNSVLFTFKYKSLNHAKTLIIPILREDYVEEFLEQLEGSLDVAVEQAEMLRNRFKNLG
ncbi:hypothetical protein [Saccharibacillus alkalitolerans]|uniref:Restriction endonuclease n=1 Tax=Saccharibacillus alkalitolerans TaxID=2705290 RepID=A0ABX0F5U1_9BACL|nr:hypothetical protein [Saccharibacillus alkalitolerans]NGZ75733.1 hypothetical protein [Saccharibacillus alkalitolerans]